MKGIEVELHSGVCNGVIGKLGYILYQPELRNVTCGLAGNLKQLGCDKRC